ncbi:acetaldehyde dehydrogenase [Anaerobacterium chartisolvens]|uniref:Acetaldehyde dehydrogenase n=1 Tax=Anaerobacterium chartisolvens TaxID=1297424 RepID=A0A369B8Z9_9FIRM|nr:acetaldehyde dehydrogenase (acetylating) [Anaerobacterium chartisolvens]RCX18009.1 acetaldehyde dehydrogenase [Anaerobacterium chartisolvens]
MGSNSDTACTDNVALSIKEANLLMQTAYDSQKLIAGLDQIKVDRIVEAMVEAGYKNARRLAVMAVEETKIGVAEDKEIKNRFATRNVHEYIKNMRTAGIIKEEPDKGVVEIASPMGVVVGIIPTTNPTSTILYKAIIAVKSRNSIVFSPHPRAIKCSLEAARLMEEAAVSAGAPKGLINCLSVTTREATDELMHHLKTSVILATGGSAMVKAAYSSGNPAYGVGPGNVPAFIERSADITDAIEKIISSKTFDNGTVCASEQAIVTEAIIAERVIDELKKQGGYFVSGADLAALENIVIQPNGGVNPKVVGQSPETIASLAGITIPEGTKVIVASLKGVGKDFPLSAEKLCPVLGLYIEKDWKEACERCFELLQYGGLGHSLVIHSKNEDIIREFAIKKPVFRILVNTPSSQGAIGYTTGVAPALTLGCGTLGGSITSDNVTPLHLINIKRLAYHLPEKTGKAAGKPSSFFYTKAEITRAIEELIKAGSK